MKLMNIGLLALLIMLGSRSYASSTITPAHPYAYGANGGWINARGDITNGAVIGQSFCTGYLWSANCGWISLGNGPTNGWQYSNTASNDWGVNHDGEGRLTGYAYGANIGWINFEQAQGLPRIDLRTGNLSGYAWGANVGWIGFSNAEAYVQSAMAAGADTDGDGIPDVWEYRRTGSLTNLMGSGHDADHDNSSDVKEYAADTNPLDETNVLAITSFTSGAGTRTLTWNSRPTRLYQIVATNSLQNASSGAWEDASSGLVGPPSGESSQMTVSDGGATTRYYRVRAVVPLAE